MSMPGETWEVEKERAEVLYRGILRKLDKSNFQPWRQVLSDKGRLLAGD